MTKRAASHTITLVSREELADRAQREHDSRVLAEFVRRSKHYRAVWGVPPGKTAFLGMWHDARQRFCLEETNRASSAFANTQINIGEAK